MLVWWGKTKLLMVSKLVIVRKKESLKPWLETSLPPAPPLIFFTHREISRNLHSILHTQVLIVIITFDHSK